MVSRDVSHPRGVERGGGERQGVRFQVTDGQGASPLQHKSTSPLQSCESIDLPVSLCVLCSTTRPTTRCCTAPVTFTLLAASNAVFRLPNPRPPRALHASPCVCACCVTRVCVCVRPVEPCVWQGGRVRKRAIRICNLGRPVREAPTEPYPRPTMAAPGKLSLGVLLLVLAGVKGA